MGLPFANTGSAAYSSTCSPVPLRIEEAQVARDSQHSRRDHGRKGDVGMCSPALQVPASRPTVSLQGSVGKPYGYS